MISLYEIIEASNGQLFGEPAAQLFDDFCLDVDKAGENLLFVALKSEHGDTHHYIPEAIERGVSGVLCSRPPECRTDGVSVVMVRDTVEALLAWAHYILGKFGTRVIGVTGSAGKSIAVDAIATVLRRKYSVHTSLREESNRLSVPLALAGLNSKHKFVVLRLGTTQPGEMAAMVQSVQPIVGVVTHISTSHTENFESSEEVAREKAVLIDYLSPSGLAVLNYDDDHVRAMGNHVRAQVRTIGMRSFGADMMAYNVTVRPDGTGFDLRCGSERYVDQWVPLFGAYHMYAVMAALSIGQYYEIPLEASLETLKGLKPLPGRMNLLMGINGSLLIDDTYSANPESTLAALDWLESIGDQQRRVFFVFGNMDSLGKHSQVGHRRIGRRAAEVADVLVTQGAEAAYSARAALDHGMDPEHVHITYTARDAIAALINEYRLAEGDLVLLKGGPSARMEQVTQELLEDVDDRGQLVRQDFLWEISTLSQPNRLTWVDIDTGALASNVRAIKSLVGDDVNLMAVVKSDAYGHGAVMAARTAILNGATYLGVSSLQEALELRDAGIAAPILVMNFTPTHLVRQAIQHDVTLTLYDLGIGRTYGRIARELDRRLRVHVKVDSGMGRLGILPQDVVGVFRHLMTLQHLEIEGIYSHFAVADEDPDYTFEQLAVFKDVIHPLQATTGFKFKYIHAANSAATVAYPETHFNMVRTGVAMYGLHPSEAVRLPDGFQPVMAWKTIVAQVKSLPPGHPVGYGGTYVTGGEETIAVLPVGYADGLRRTPNTWREVLVHGQRAPVVGRVSMEKTTINVTHIPEVAIGDEVVLLGRQGGEAITAEEIAGWLDTINYEVTCTILPRVPRH